MEPIRQQWIPDAVAGKSFIEVGGLWGVVNEQVTTAHAAGATRLTQIDPGGEDLWASFRQRCSAAQITDCKCIVGDINDPALPAAVEPADVVHCSGVLYHCPHPLYTLQQLRRLTKQTLLLGCATIPEKVANRAGELCMEPGSALFVPAATPSQLSVLVDYMAEVGARNVPGIDQELPNGWNVADYGPWWWYFTPRFVESLLTLAGFRVRYMSPYWRSHATYYWATPN
jgi:Methyltransferase domain